MAGTPKIIILSEQFRGRTFELTKDLHTVGRVDERDICIKDPTISTYHCAFVRTGDAYSLKDEGSTNGTRINNIPISGEQELQHSDIIQVGGIELLYDCDDKSVTTVMQTQTNIDITKGVTQTVRLADKRGFSEKSTAAASQQKAFLAVIVILGIVVLALIGFLIYMMVFKNAPDASGAAAVPRL